MCFDISGWLRWAAGMCSRWSCVSVWCGELGWGMFSRAPSWCLYKSEQLLPMDPGENQSIVSYTGEHEMTCPDINIHIHHWTWGRMFCRVSEREHFESQSFICSVTLKDVHQTPVYSSERLSINYSCNSGPDVYK